MDASPITLDSNDVGGLGATRGATLSDRVREILPELETMVERSEIERTAPREMLQLFTDVGFWRHFVPKCYGGEEGGVYDWFQAVRLLGSVDLSAAWTAGLASCHSPPFTFFSERAQDELWGKTPDVITGTAGAPPAQAKRVDGGVIVNGRMGFASGCNHAHWILCYFMEPVESGEVVRFGALMPREDIKIEDTWFIAGMRGTGSNTVILENVFVPDHRIAPFPVHEKGPITKTNQAPLFRLSHWALFGSAFGPLIIGGMEQALRIARDAMIKKVSAATGKTSLDNIPSQMRYAEAKLKAEAAIALIDMRWRETDDQANKGEMETLEQFHRWRAVDYHATRTAVEVVETLMNSASSSAYYDSFPLQRFWRDIHVASRHPFLDGDGILQSFARHELGLPRNKDLMFG